MNDTPSTPEAPPAPQPTPSELFRDAIWSAFQPLFVLPKDEALRFECGDVVAYVPRENVMKLLAGLKASPFDLTMLLDVTAVDWMDQRDDRFEVVYQLLGIEKRSRVTVKTTVAESAPQLESATGLWKSANFLEREVWDMFGITFKGHPDLRRILLYEEFVGHPLRKDYPVQGKQPRVPLRKPEVENTARQMKRGDLVGIRTRKSANGAA